MLSQMISTELVVRINSLEFFEMLIMYAVLAFRVHNQALAFSWAI